MVLVTTTGIGVGGGEGVEGSVGGAVSVGVALSVGVCVAVEVSVGRAVAVSVAVGEAVHVGAGVGVGGGKVQAAIATLAPAITARINKTFDAPCPRRRPIGTSTRSTIGPIRAASGSNARRLGEEGLPAEATEPEGVAQNGQPACGVVVEA